MKKLVFLILFFSLTTSTWSHAQPSKESLLQMISYEMSDFPLVHFVSLSELYGYHEKDSLSVVLKKYRDGPSVKNQNFHELAPAQRKLFLERCGIQESECLYLYDLGLNKLSQFEVQDLKAVAFLNFYESRSDYDIPEYYFHIGFEIPHEKLDANHEKYGIRFGQIAKLNPFVKEGVKALEFDSVSCDEWRNYDSLAANIDTSCNCFEAFDGDYFYRVLGHGRSAFPSSRYLVIMDSSNHVISARHYHDSEGSYLPGLDIRGSQYSQKQWSGRLLKNQGPFIYGFIGYSFGCAGVEYIKPGIPPSYVLCDNRH